MCVEFADIRRDNKQHIFVPNSVSKILTGIMNCQTHAMGWHRLLCTDSDCPYNEKIYNSCKSRYCPKCQVVNQLEWDLKKMKETLPVDHCHITFPIPSSLNKLFLNNQRECFNMHFKSVNTTLKKYPSKSKKKNGQIGFIAVLHTNTQKLHFYPHVHCLIPEGKINGDKSKWIQCKKEQMFKRDKLVSLYKINLMNEIEKAFKEGKLKLPETDSKLKYTNSLELTIKQAKKCSWNIHIRRPVHDAAEVIEYLGHNIKKVPISNNRLISYENNIVKFKWWDRADGYAAKEEELDAVKFLKRYILHILPHRFARIRYFGFLSNVNKKKNLILCKELIKKAGIQVSKNNKEIEKKIEELILRITKPKICPRCNVGFLVLESDLINAEKSKLIADHSP